MSDPQANVVQESINAALAVDDHLVSHVAHQNRVRDHPYHPSAHFLTLEELNVSVLAQYHHHRSSPLSCSILPLNRSRIFLDGSCNASTLMDTS